MYLLLLRRNKHFGDGLSRGVRFISSLMSLLTFLGLRQPKYKFNRAPLTLADVLHRTLVTGLTALSIYGIYLGYSVHDHVMIKGKGASHFRRFCS